MASGFDLSGNSHDSSQVHEMVITHLANAGPNCKQLDDLRMTAEKSRDVIYAENLAALGHVMIENTDAQGRLPPALIRPSAQRVIEIAKEHGAAGWKVNGSGGAGRSITILCGALSHQKRTMLREIEAGNSLCRTPNLLEPAWVARPGGRV